MPTKVEQMRIAVLDDYQNVALSMADWSALEGRAAITVFNDYLDGTDAVVAHLVSRTQYERFYHDTVHNIVLWLDGEALPQKCRSTLSCWEPTTT
jgi:hypothetical protein